MILVFFTLLAQFSGNNIYGLYEDQDFSLDSGDIFSNFYEDLETGQVLEDERFFSYSRFFSISFSVGTTSFDGNRGNAYEDEPPSAGVYFMIFSDIQSALGLGYEYSKHNFYLAQGVKNFHTTDPSIGAGNVDVNMSRLFLFYRYYLNIKDLGTAITFSNPYFTMRTGYWLFTNNFTEQSSYPKENGGGFNISVGAGLEFPIKLQASYIGVEMLYHFINFSDSNTGAFGPYEGNTYGYPDFAGNAYSIMISYVFNW